MEIILNCRYNSLLEEFNKLLEHNEKVEADFKVILNLTALYNLSSMSIVLFWKYRGKPE